MAVPVVITTSSRALMDVVDFEMLSRLKDSDVQAAILPSQMIMWVYIVFGLGIASLVSTFSSQALGANRKSDCSTYAWQGIYVAMFVGFIALLGRPFLPYLIGMMGHSEGVQGQELAYTRIALLTVFPTVASGALGWFFIGVHKPWVNTWSVIEANLVNFVVSFVLIFGMIGFEPMGIAGAAWGTLVGVSYRVVRLSATMLLPAFDREFRTRSTWRPCWPVVKQLLHRGVPAGLHWVSEVGVWAIFITIMVGKYFDKSHLVATNIAWQYMRIAFMPAIGVGQALTAMVGKSLGAGKPEVAKLHTRLATRMTLVYLGALSLIYLLARHPLIARFNPDPTVVEVGAAIMVCAAVFQLFDALGIVYDGALRGAGDTIVPSVVYMFNTWIMLVGVAWLMITTFPALGSLGPWIAATTMIATSALFVTWRWHSGAWRKINIFSASGQDAPTEVPARIDEPAEEGEAVAAEMS
jgi:MATE family multidrug resistance protein